MNDFDKGMEQSFGTELSAMGETISVGGVEAQAVVDSVETSRGLDGAVLLNDATFDVYILKTTAETLKLTYRTKVTLVDRDGISGRVVAMLPIEGGQIRARIDTNNER